MAKFKVGDVVRVFKDDYRPALTGHLGIVRGIGGGPQDDKYPYSVQLLSDPDDGYWFGGHELEKANGV